MAADCGLDHNLQRFSKCPASLTTIGRGAPRRGGEGQKGGHQGDCCDTAPRQAFTIPCHGFLLHRLRTTEHDYTLIITLRTRRLPIAAYPSGTPARSTVMSKTGEGSSVPDWTSSISSGI